jgi:hypothetical protein
MAKKILMYFLPVFLALHILSYPFSYPRDIGSLTPMLVVLQFFPSALPDSTLDGPPFVLFHPNFDTQNDKNSIITGVIDWNGVYVGPRQDAAAAYPS